MSMTDSLRRAARLARRCGTLGVRGAARLAREDARIRKEQARTDLMTPGERRREERAGTLPGIRFDLHFLQKDGETVPREQTLRSLAEQTWHGFRQEPEGSETSGYTVFLEPDAVLHPGALRACAEAAAAGAELIYTDEDYYTERPKDRNTPFYKPDYGPDSLRGCNYAGPFMACRTALLGGTGAKGFAAADAAARWDETVRMARAAKKTAHIPRVLVYRYAEAGIPLPETRRVKDPLAGEPLISILIPNRDHAEDLRRCTDSIRERTTYPRYEILILENNSGEEATFRLYEELTADPRIRVIPREGAFNFSALNNLGVREAKGSQLVLLNNDTEVLTPDWLQEMLRYTQRPDVGAAGAKLLYPDGTIQHAGIGIGILTAAGHWHRGFAGNSPGSFGRLTYAQNVTAVTAACLMISRKAYEDAGGLDESFPVMFNDLDLCLRLRKKGYLNVWTPEAELIHHESRSRGTDFATAAKKRFFFRETDRFVRRWRKELIAGDPYYNPNLTLEREDYTPRGGPA